MGVVLASDGWHPGVIGIVASRIVEKIQRPVLIIALDGERGRGSGRSIPGFNLFEALKKCSEYLIRFGGHEQAAGMDVAREALPALREAFSITASQQFSMDELRPELFVDLEIGLESIDLQLIHWLKYLGPHGIGNASPVFIIREVAFKQTKIVGTTVSYTHLTLPTIYSV